MRGKNDDCAGSEKAGSKTSDSHGPILGDRMNDDFSEFIGSKLKIGECIMFGWELLKGTWDKKDEQ